MDTETPATAETSGLLVRSHSPLICFSHLRWDFVTQRPQHLMRRFAQRRRVFFFEEYIPCDHHLPFMEFHPFPEDNLVALRPRLPHWWDETAREVGLRSLLNMLVETTCQEPPALWFYTPMMFAFARDLRAAVVAYDCMDELSHFRFADPRLQDMEHALMNRAEIVFTGGHSLFQARCDRHPNVHLFPSSIDAAHFSTSRSGMILSPTDQAEIRAPRLGFYGVIDERIDLCLLESLALARPGWSFVMVGPLAKIEPASLPRLPNLHWLGAKPYAELPAYLAGWDVALMPFAMNAATQFISPTKTPEYLSAGKPVVSTPIADVVRQYGSLQAVTIAASTSEFLAACERAMHLPREGDWRDAADAALAGSSWARTQEAMALLLDAATPNGPIPGALLAEGARLASPIVRVSSQGKPFDVLVVGAGFAGATLAEQLARSSGKRVMIIDQRDHVAGNAADYYNEAGILVHRYGPHIFHTNSQEVFNYLSRFTTWRAYEHRVLASISGMLVPMPINRTTLNMLYRADLRNEAETAAFLAARAVPVDQIRTAEDVVISSLGRELYELFFRGYTRKQWGMDPSELDRSVTARVPARITDDDRYFLDRFQAMPSHGYTRMFDAMLDHENIVVQLGTEFRDVQKEGLAAHTIYTGPIDEFFDFRFGRLPYRSLEFRHTTFDQEQFQPAAVVNYSSEDIPFTRITEYKYLTGQRHPRTSVSYEYPSSEGEPYYPIPRPDNQAMYRCYQILADGRPDVSFVGRLATYRYYNMDQVVGQALATYRRLMANGVLASAVEA